MIISCIDTETTGLNKNTDRVIQLSVTNFDSETGERTEKFNWYINPSGQWKINPGAEEVHHISEEFIRKNGKSLKEVHPEFMKAIEGHTILTYNGTTFDIVFLQKDFEREGMDGGFENHEYIDAFDIERRLNSNKLSDAYRRYFGKDFEDAHDSSADVEATIDVYMEQMRRFSDLKSKDSDKFVIEESNEEVTKSTVVSPEGFVYVDKDGVLKFRIGKFKEWPVSQVCKENPSYIKWLFTPNNGDNIITNLTKRSIRESYYKNK
jgi:DNA polymerase III epsilon subunit-like protein